jgi:hypothetical protein
VLEQGLDDKPPQSINMKLAWCSYSACPRDRSPSVRSTVTFLSPFLRTST